MLYPKTSYTHSADRNVSVNNGNDDFYAAPDQEIRRISLKVTHLILHGYYYSFISIG